MDNNDDWLPEWFWDEPPPKPKPLSGLWNKWAAQLEFGTTPSRWLPGRIPPRDTYIDGLFFMEPSFVTTPASFGLPKDLLKSEGQNQATASVQMTMIKRRLPGPETVPVKIRYHDEGIGLDIYNDILKRIEERK